MHATLDVNSEEKLLESVTMLRHARRIVITGIGASGLVAQNFAWKLLKIGINAVVERDMHALLATVQALAPEDLLLAISYSGERRELNLAADETLRAGAKIPPLPVFLPTPCSSAPPAVCIRLLKSRRRAAPLSPQHMRK